MAAWVTQLYLLMSFAVCKIAVLPVVVVDIDLRSWWEEVEAEEGGCSTVDVIAGVRNADVE